MNIVTNPFDGLELDRLLRGYGITDADMHGRTLTRQTLYCRRSIPNTAIAAGSTLKFFHVGRENEESTLGYTGGGQLETLHTNLDKDGELPQQEWFIAIGVGFRFPYNAAIADVDKFGRAAVQWRERGDKSKLELGRLAEMPAFHDLGYAVEGGGASAAIREQVRATGYHYVSHSGLFAIFGDGKRFDRGYLAVQPLEGFTPATTVIEAQVVGIRAQVSGQLPSSVRGTKARAAGAGFRAAA